jgi:anti-anti-sigma factor
MEIQIRTDADITIVDLNDEIDVSQAPRLRQALTELFENTEVKKLLINMTDVIYIDSAGLSVLIAAHRQISDRDGAFGLSNLQQPVRQVCHITGIDKVIQIFPTVEEALTKL